MDKKADTSGTIMANEPSESQKFLAGLRKIVSVPKAEILRREKAAKEERTRQRRKNERR